MEVRSGFRTSPPKALISGGIIMIVLGLVMAIAAGILMYNYNKKEKAYIQTTGVVVEYSSQTEHSDEFPEVEYETYAPIVEYEVDGKKYKALQKSYSDNPPDIGSKMELRYNKNNPKDVVFEKDKKDNIFFLIVAGGFVVLGLMLIIIAKVKLKKESEVY